MKYKRSNKIVNLLSKNLLFFTLIFLYRNFYRFVRGIEVSNVRDIYRFQKYQDKFKGKRCFIIGNGPSLNKTDLSLLKNEYTFGLNRIYLIFQKMGFTPTFLISINKLLISQCWKELKNISIPKFISSSSKHYFKGDSNTIIIRTHGDFSFTKDPTTSICEGSTVTFVAMQIAYIMGFSEVILIGVDHNFKTIGRPNTVVDQKNDDPNHFSRNYFKGMKWQLPDLETSELAYRLAKYYFEKDGRKILNATVGGKLTVFGKVSYKKLFN